MQATKWSRRAAVAAAIAGIAAVTMPAPADAQDFPTKPITIVVPFGPGTANDIIARQLAQDMTGTLGQSVIVENRAGATGNIATDFVAKSRPDGYTLLIASTSLLLNQVTGNATSDLTRDFAPVAFSGGTFYSTFVPNELPVKERGRTRRARPPATRQAQLRRLCRRLTAVPGRDAEIARPGSTR